VGFVARRVESFGTAEDIVHDVLERFQRRDDTEPVVDVDAWLYRSARNAIIDHYRARRFHDALPDDIEDTTGGDNAPNEATRELSNCLRPLIVRLPAKYRTAVTLVDLEDRTHQAAAEAEAISVSGMKSRVQRGRIKLREMLTECCTVETNNLGQISDYRSNRDRCGC